MATARIVRIGRIAITFVLGASSTSCLRPPMQAAPLASNVGAAPAAAPDRKNTKLGAATMASRQITPYLTSA